MKVAILCEESQTVCKAFRSLGHEAYSYDLQECSGGHPEWHIQQDIREMIDEYFDLVIFHPECRYLTNSGVRWLYTEPLRWQKLFEAGEFFNLRHRFNSPRVATENPIPHKYATQLIGEKDQIIHPWEYGHGETKATFLWLKGLPPLQPTNIVEGREGRIWRMAPGPERSKMRSKTYQGIAEAMASQCGSL